jgi:BirA family biotin operon repressor/biotin-[acetyl-CoA-carboxylase] ligase
MSRLDAASVRRPLSEHSDSRLEKLEIFSEIASTNTHLLTQAAPAAGHFRVAIADHQTSGRGRHDRRWESAPGAGLCLSFSYTFAKTHDELSALTLAIGVAVIDALRSLGIEDVSLKWPNDIVALDGKLGGILTEVQSTADSGVTVVAGIGLNVCLGETTDIGLDSDWARQPVDLASISENPPDRERLAGTIIEHLNSAFTRFEESGFKAFADEWRRHDWLSGKEITVDMPDRQVSGRAAGVADDGVLLVETGGGVTRIVSGSIVLAARADT